MPRSGRVVRGLVCAATVSAALSSIALGGVAASTLLADPDGQEIVAAGTDGVSSGAFAPDRPATVVPAGDIAPPAAPVSTITPGRNPPLMAVGSSSELVRELQVRLGSLDLYDATVTGYFGEVTEGAVAAYQTSRGLEPTGEVYPELWAALRTETPTPTDEQLYPPPPVATPPTVDASSLDARCLTGRALCVDKTDRTLHWVVNGRVILEMDARFGSQSLPTREGQFAVYWKSRDHVSQLYDAEMPFAMFFDGGQAVHYSPDFAAHGYDGASHGCVNIRDYDGMAWLFDQVHVGDKVVVYWS